MPREPVASYKELRLYRGFSSIPETLEPDKVQSGRGGICSCAYLKAHLPVPKFTQTSNPPC
jgi:hypothetical protein